jgi:hypothetical protein
VIHIVALWFAFGVFGIAVNWRTMWAEFDRKPGAKRVHIGAVDWLVMLTCLAVVAVICGPFTVTMHWEPDT